MSTNYSTCFFILGNPRSGTTLLRLMLDSHPNVTVPPESGFMMWFYPKYKDYNRSRFDVEGIIEFVDDVQKAKKIENWNLDFEKLKKYLIKSNPKSYQNIIDRTYRFFADQNYDDTILWGDKNNFYIYHIKELNALFPNSKFIHLVRDGRDVACSYRELNNKKIESRFAPKLPNDISDIANVWNLNNQGIFNDLQEIGMSERTLMLRYEDLVRAPEKELTKITDFLNITYNSKMLEYYKNSVTYEPKDFLQWKANTKKAPQTQSINRYRSELTKEEINLFNEIAIRTLEQHNYEL